MVYDKTIDGSKIQLRSVALCDCNARYLGWMMDEETNRYMETRWTEQTMGTIQSFVNSIRASSDSWLFAIIYQGQHVGNIKIGPINKRYKNADISYFTGDKSLRGKGVASEAIGLVLEFGFKVLNLHRIQAGAFKDNVASQRALLKNGFRLEGTFREKYFLTSDSEWTDCLEFAILKNEWEAFHGTK